MLDKKIHVFFWAEIVQFLSNYLKTFCTYLDQKTQVNILRFGLSSANLTIVFVANINTLQWNTQKIFVNSHIALVSLQHFTIHFNFSFRFFTIVYNLILLKIFSLQVLPFWRPEKERDVVRSPQMST